MARKQSDVTVIRMPKDVKRALARAADDEVVPPSTLARTIIAGWLRRRSYLPPKSNRGGR